MTRHFDSSLFDFLAELDENNNREWFLANKTRFETLVRAPALRFIAAAGPSLYRLSPRIVADPKPHGGSLMRVYRDTRFSNDKTPYKTNVGINFPHGQMKHVHSPGFYLHLAPREIFIGAGIWHPEADVLRKIRNGIVRKPKDWTVATRRVRKKLDGDALQRPPRDYAPNHPLIEDLKRKDFITVVNLTERQVCSPNFMKNFTAACRESAPLMRFLCGALGLRW